MKSEIEIKKKLKELEKFCNREQYTSEEMQGEIQGLKFSLNTLGEDL
jgi:hypothetical protein